MTVLNHVEHTKKSLPEIGRESKILLGRQTDIQLLEFLNDNPGVTMSDISRELGWTIGKVQGAITRLEKSEQIVLEKILKDGRVANLIYPMGYRSVPGVIKVDKDVLDDPDKWIKQLNIYAMNRSTIVITPDSSAGLEENSFHKSSVVPEVHENHVVVTLPMSFTNFYQLQSSDSNIASNGKAIFVNVNAPVKALVSDTVNTNDLPLDSKILIMEDDRNYARTLRSALYKYFAKIELSSSEGEVKEKIAQIKPDYLILDWDIANKKAAERILKWMKSVGKNIPAAVITSQDYDDDDEKRLKEGGFDAFYDKVTNQLPKVLSSHIIRTLRSKKQR
jgi:CheY-like chemotaxis protein